MALQLTGDMILGIGALAVSAIAIIMFLRATSDVSKKEKTPEKEIFEPKVEPIKLNLESNTGYVKVSKIESVTKREQVEQARSKIRTLTLKQEILSMVMKRLFEAEDEGEISREERERLASNYEAEMKDVSKELNKAELIVSLNELEEIRASIIQQFQDTLNDTQQKIDIIISELDIREPKLIKTEPEIKTTPPKRPRRVRPKPKIKPKPEEEPEELEEEEETSQGSSVEDRLSRLKEDVMKELEELERMELEA
jgi:hypothetical protein